MTCFSDMNTMTIKLNDFISCQKGITPGDGEPIYERIIDAFHNGDSVILDFDGVEMMTTAFLNVVIGNLYKDYTSDQLKGILSFINLPNAVAVRIKKVTDNAKLFYNDQEKFTKSVEDVINGSN